MHCSDLRRRSWRDIPSRTPFLGQTLPLRNNHSPSDLHNPKQTTQHAPKASFTPPGFEDALQVMLPLLGKAAIGIGAGASSMASLASNLLGMAMQVKSPPPPPPATGFFLAPWIPFLSFGPLPFLFGLTSVFWGIPLAIAAIVFTTFAIMTVFSFLGDLADLERRLSGAAVSTSSGPSVVPETVPFWTYLPLLAPVGWWHLAKMAGDKATSARCSQNMLLYAAPTALFLCGLAPPTGGAVFLAPVLGPLHLELERRILHKDRLLKLIDEAESAGSAQGLNSDNKRGTQQQQASSGGRASEDGSAAQMEEEQEQRRREQELAMFDSMLEARWWSGRAAPKAWSVDDVSEWILKEGFSRECADAFVSNHITGEVLLELSDDDLRQHLDIRSFGLRRSLVSRITELRSRRMESNTMS